MAQQRSLKNFYLGLGVVALVGVGAMYWASQRSAGPAVAVALPVAVGTDSVAPDSYVVGSDSAPVVVDEWSDFECPFCARLAILVVPDVQQRLVATGLVRWRFNDFPLPGHRNAPAAHLAAACAAEQGQFWAMHDQLYYNQGQWVREGNPSRRFRDYARVTGVDMDAWEECVDGQRYAARIQGSVQRGAALGVSGTPTLFINGQPFRGSALSFDELRTAVEAAPAARQ